ncbi:MAG: ATP-dependent DNA helicase RecG [Patescibacteria group bacterium]|nr:MAG: ATP-dependent DNA helicase RecG [Patescibacteria group bacterium]
MNLSSPIEKEFRVDKRHKAAFVRLGLTTLRDLLYYFPARYHHISNIKKIAHARAGKEVILYGRVVSAKMSKAYRKKIPLAEAIIEDGTGSIKAVWFHQAYIAKRMKKGDMVKLAGKVTEGSSGLYLANPEFEHAKELPMDIGTLFGKDTQETLSYPVYPESRGITSRWLYHAMQRILGSGVMEELRDPLPKEILKKYRLPTLRTALVWVHAPRKESDALAARKRFAFEEIFFIQLERQRVRHAYRQNPTFVIDVEKKEIDSFLKRFPFKPTGAQESAITSIVSDLKKDTPMTRLLEGDVGSGKTLVAAATTYATIMTRPLKRPETLGRSSQGDDSAQRQDFGNLQVAYMAPTEILANQHFESFIEYFEHLSINIGLLTGSGCKKFPSKVNPGKATKISRTQLLKWVENGEIPILIGTHALIQKTVRFKYLAYVIIDEQHRFGIKQRMELVQKDGKVPHLLSMTATPIPRTLALTIYGDLDLTLLDEMPAGRKEIITEIVPVKKREEVYEKVRKKLKNGQQAYVICPRIEEPDPDKASALRVKSVKAEAERLKEKVFPKYEIDVLHGKMKPKEKEDVMGEFANRKTDILVATSVVEVGVNVPNATTIVIEGAERFGLAQLHQLRGRVLRSTHQAYCFLFANTKTKQSLGRLKALTTAKDGFKLSELDLELRGAGQLTGEKQWGISDLGMEAIKNIKMVEAARIEAIAMMEKDPGLKGHPAIKERLSGTKADIHLE